MANLNNLLNTSIRGISTGRSIIERAVSAKNSKDAKEEQEFDDLTEFMFSENLEEMQSQLQTLVSKATGCRKTGLFARKEDKRMLAVLKEKIEYGIMKLEAAGKTTEAAFFQKKLDKINED